MNLMHFAPMIRLLTVGILLSGIVTSCGDKPQKSETRAYASKPTAKTQTRKTLPASRPEAGSVPEKVHPTPPHFDQEPRIPGDFKGNYVWAAPINLAWEELRENILGEPFSTSDTTPEVVDIIDKLNAAQFSKKDLDAASYYVRSGFGQSVIDTIRAELKKKFPRNKVNLSDVQLSGTDLFLFAFLQKNLQYEYPFKNRPVKFQDKWVKGFIDSNQEQRANVRILHYASDAQFLIRIILQQDKDELFLAKGFDMDNPSQVLGEIRFKANRNEAMLDHEDRFSAPNLDLKFSRAIPFANTALNNPGFEAYSLSSIQENIFFKMDNAGVDLEAETRYMVKGGGDAYKKRLPKLFYLDAPYWLIMKRRRSQLPYLILGIRNTAMMTLAPKGE